MWKEGEIMAYSRIEKYQELRDGLKEEAGISREKTTAPVEIEKDEDDDFLSFMKDDEPASKPVNLEDTLTEAKTFEQMREEGSKELEEALKSAKRGVGKETEYNTRMDILSKIREPEKTTIKIDSVDEYKTEEFSKGMFLNETSEEVVPTEIKTEGKERKKMTFMERLASMSPEEDAKKAEEFLKSEEMKKEQEIIAEVHEEIIEDELPVEEDSQRYIQEEIEPEEVQQLRRKIDDEEDVEVNQEIEKKQGGQLVKILDAVIAILVAIFIVLLGVIIYQNFF